MNKPLMAPVGGHVLLDLKAYLQEHNQASMRDLSTHFRLAPDALRGMLDHWIRKRRVERHDFTGGCSCEGKSGSSCGNCGVEDSFEFYEWIGNANGDERRKPGNDVLNH